MNSLAETKVDSEKIDPELRPVLNSTPLFSGPELSLSEIRAKIESLPVPPYKHLAGVVSKDFLIPGADAVYVPVRVYMPEDRNNANELPALLWIHGGGFFLGDIDGNDPLCEKIVLKCNCIVVSVGYRRVPEHPFPAPVDDCIVALNWLAADNDLNIDKNRIAVGGASAGGCLAAALALHSRDKAGPKIAYQVLMIPVTDDRHETPSSQAFHDPRIWCRDISLRAWAAYLKNVEGEPPAYAAPARAEDLSNLPPAFVSVEDQDLLRDEGIEYAQRLMQAGVLTELHVYPGTFHGSFGAVPKASTSKRHIADMLTSLRKALQPR